MTASADLSRLNVCCQQSYATGMAHGILQADASWRETLRKERDARLNAERLKNLYRDERDAARSALKEGHPE